MQKSLYTFSVLILLLTGCQSGEKTQPIDGAPASSEETASFPTGGGENPGIYRHPLDPLTAEEISLTRGILALEQKTGPETRFAMIDLHEPPKAEVKDPAKWPSIGRFSYALMFDWANLVASEAIVDLTNQKVHSWNDLEEKFPPARYLVSKRIEEIVMKDPRWYKAIEKRGVTSKGDYFFYARTEPRLENGELWVEGVAAINNAKNIIDRFNITLEVNLSKGTLIKFRDKGDRVAHPSGNIYEDPTPRPGLKPLSIQQPEGPSFTIEGSKVTWQNWTLHYGVHPIRGLEIFDVTYNDNGRVRPVLYRAALSEIVTPYGDPDRGTHFPIDGGDFMFANYGTRPAIEGEDAPPQAVYRNVTLHDPTGTPVEIPRGVAIFEQDGGLLWRHNERAHRARDLVLTSYVMIDNYDYALTWIFQQDGTIEAQVMLTGAILHYIVNKDKDNTPPADSILYFNTLCASDVAGPIHQHFITYRVDLDVDGPSNNTILEINAQPLPEDNPRGEWFFAKARALESELQAKRNINTQSSRWWKIINTREQNDLGQQTAYSLLPKDNAFPFTLPHAKVRRKMKYLDAQLWVTKFQEEEMYAGGKYLNYNLDGEGLPKWTQADRNIKDEDIVLWYTLGFTHLPRPEDWPSMPRHKSGFILTPYGFFEHNPALNLPKKHPWESEEPYLGEKREASDR